MKNSNHIAGILFGMAAVVIFGAVPNVNGSTALERFAITAGPVTQALATAGISAKSTEVEFLSAVSSMRQNPQLTLVNVSTWRDGNLKALIRCESNRECLPFYVVVHDKKLPARSSNVFHGSPKSSAPHQQARRKAADKPLVHGGQVATLVLRNQDLQITIPVLCLESGRKGETIRLSSPDRKRHYMGEVVEAGLLQGKF